MKMNCVLRRKSGWCGLVLALVAGTAALAQTRGLLPVGEAASLISSTALSNQIPAESIIREIDDSRNGVRWLLLRDESHPGGPGRLVPVAGSAPAASLKSAGKANSPAGSAHATTAVPGAAVSSPVVRAGDRLIVEEHTRVADVRLEAVALGAATAGSALNVRLKVGGKVLRAIATESGRATLQAETEARP